MKKDYTIGLDIGTNSVGWAVLNDDYTVVSKKRWVKTVSPAGFSRKKVRKNFMGSYIFEEGETAADRRLKRASRRRLARRRNRIRELNKIFEQKIAKVDENFLRRLDESFLQMDDDKKSVKEKYPLFRTEAAEKEFYRKYPTIYHLRKHLVDDPSRADIREIYLAIHHILKYRGHFIYEEREDFNTDRVDVARELKELFDALSDADVARSGERDIDEMAKILQDKSLNRTRKVEMLREISGAEKRGPEENLFKLVVGNKTDLAKIFDDVDGKTEVQLSSSNVDEQLESAYQKLSDERADIVERAKMAYDAVILSEILTAKDKNTGAKLSASMVERYEAHREQLKDLKKFAWEICASKKKRDEIFGRGGIYSRYIAGESTKASAKSATKYEDFAKELKKFLEPFSENEFVRKVFADLDAGEYLPKQRTFRNGAIPFQIHRDELRKIIANQKQFYPFLGDEIDGRNKLETLLSFRIPYYVGPLAKGHSAFGWAVRQSAEKITPYNFERVIDRDASAEKFIERMTNYDTYLPREKVLPKNSLLYQKFAVMNELSKVKIDRDFLDGEQKRAILDGLFEQKRKVGEKDLRKFVARQGWFPEDCEISGLNGAAQNGFNASYATFIDFAKIGIAPEKIRENALEFEEIVKWQTIFEDKKILRRKISQKYSDILNEDEIRAIAKKHYTGWGRFSGRLIDGICDEKSESGWTILDFLESDKYHLNFMQLINDDKFSFKKIISDEATDGVEDLSYDVVGDLPASPAVKKGIWNTLKIVREIVEIMGAAPKNIVIEFARENDSSKRAPEVKEALEVQLKSLGGVESVRKELAGRDEKSFASERLRLYFMQNGKDLYTGQALEIDRLSDYDVDHIWPQSVVKDDSYDNKVLTSSSANRGKSGDVLSDEIRGRMRGLWMELRKASASADGKRGVTPLMSQKKLDHLLRREPFSKNEKFGFERRQLVETRQIMKRVAAILHEYFSDKDEDGSRKTNIVTPKAALASQFRRENGFYKIRELNDYHHAQDAYANAVVSLFLLKTRSDIAGEFIYGERSTWSKKSASERKYFSGNLLLPMLQRVDKRTGEIVFSGTVAGENGEILWDEKRDLEITRKVMNSKNVQVVKQTEPNDGKFSDESRLAAGSGSISYKRGLEIAKYGGQGSPIVAYSVPIERKSRRGKVSYRLEPVTVMEKSSYERDPQEFVEAKCPGESVRILSAKPLKKYQLYALPGGGRRMLASAKEAQKGDQFVLPDNLTKLLFFAKKYDKMSDRPLNRDGFREIVERIKDFADETGVAIPKRIGSLDDVLARFDEFSDEDIAKGVMALLNLTMRGTVNLSSDAERLGLKKDRIRMTSTSDLDIFNPKSELIYQSPTGLRELHRRMV